MAEILTRATCQRPFFLRESLPAGRIHIETSAIIALRSALIASEGLGGMAYCTIIPPFWRNGEPRSVPLNREVESSCGHDSPPLLPMSSIDRAQSGGSRRRLAI